MPLATIHPIHIVSSPSWHPGEWDCETSSAPLGEEMSPVVLHGSPVRQRAHEEEDIKGYSTRMRCGSFTSRLTQLCRGKTNDPWLLDFMFSSSSLNVAYVHS
ncbi:hypothetical protein ACFE04_002967 [Oxalis oulophora]